MRQLKYLFTAALMAFAVTACDEGTSVTPPEPPPEPLNGEISGVVTAEGSPLIGVQVSISGNGVQQVGATDGVGGFVFRGLDRGTYTVSIADVEGVTFNTTSTSVTLSDGSSSGSVAFNGEFIRTSSITGTVTLAGDGASGIGVNLSGEETRAATTGSDGSYSFTGLKSGTYTVTINAPEGSSFPVTSQSATLGVGDAEVLNFEGDLPLTATVAIKSITTGILNTPVNPANVAGQIDVTVTVADPDNQIRTLEVLVDGVPCAGCSQSFGAPGVGDAELAPSGEYVYTILTASVDPADGSVNYANGIREITVEGQTSNESVTTASSVDLVFNNADTWIILSATAPGGPLVGENDTNVWWGNGDLTVDAGFAGYSGNSVTSAAAALTNSTDPAATGAQAGNIFSFVFDTPESTDLVNGSALSITGALDVGGAVTFTSPTALFLDQTGPAGGVLNLLDQSANNQCCSNNWFNPDYALNGGHTIGADAGVGFETATQWAFDPAGFATPAAPTQAEMAAATATGWSGPTGGEMVDAAGTVGLPFVDQNTDWVMAAEEKDGLGNTFFTALTASADSPLNGTAGHDGGPPTSGFCTGAGTPDVNCTVVSLVDGDIFNAAAPYTNEGFQMFAFDVGTPDVGGPSGMTPGSEVFGTLQQLDATGTTCLVGAVVNGVCTDVSIPGAPSGQQGDGATGAQAYFTFDATPRDRAGNFGTDPGPQTMLVDLTTMVITAIFPPQGVLIGGTAPNFISTWTDNLDGASVVHALDYALGGVNGPLLKTGETAIVDGTFGPPLATGGDINATVPFLYRRIDRSNPVTTSLTIPGLGITNENLQPLTMTVFGIDVAGNVGQNTSGALVVEPTATDGFPNNYPQVLTWEFRHADAVLDISNGDAVTVEAVLTGTLGQVTSPCTRVELYMLDAVTFAPTLLQEFIGNMTALAPEEDNTERRWRYQFVYTASATSPAAITFMALCSDAAGDAVVTFNAGVTTVP